MPRVLNVDYRMLPRYPIRSAIVDALDGYRWLHEIGYGGGDTVVAGDSAGDYLAFMTPCRFLWRTYRNLPGCWRFRR